jgi:hypothetical protein
MTSVIGDKMSPWNLLILSWKNNFSCFQLLQKFSINRSGTLVILARVATVVVVGMRSQTQQLVTEIANGVILVDVVVVVVVELVVLFEGEVGMPEDREVANSLFGLECNVTEVPNSSIKTFFLTLLFAAFALLDKSKDDLAGCK